MAFLSQFVYNLLQEIAIHSSPPEQPVGLISLKGLTFTCYALTGLSAIKFIFIAPRFF